MWNLFSSLKTDLQPCRKGHMVPEELQLHSWGQVGRQGPDKRACGHLPCLIRDTSKTFHLGQAIPKHTHEPIRTADSYGATLWVGFFRLKKCLFRGDLSFADSLGYLQRNTIDSSVCHSPRTCWASSQLILTQTSLPSPKAALLAKFPSALILSLVNQTSGNLLFTQQTKCASNVDIQKTKTGFPKRRLKKIKT